MFFIWGNFKCTLTEVPCVFSLTYTGVSGSKRQELQRRGIEKEDAEPAQRRVVTRDQGRKGGGVSSRMDTGCYKATQRHKRPHNTADTKVHCFFPRPEQTCLFQTCDTKATAARGEAYLRTHPLLKTRRAPQKSSLALGMPLSISSTKTVFRSQSGRWELITEFLLHSPRFEIWIRRATSDWSTFFFLCYVRERHWPLFLGLTAPEDLPQELLAHLEYFSHSLALR